MCVALVLFQLKWYYCFMFSREETSRIRQEFWTTFGKYMNPVPSAEGLRINWINYHTRVKDVYFRMDAGSTSASISISMEHRDVEMQQLFFEQFESLKSMLESFMEEEWEWQLHVEVHGRVVSRIVRTIKDVSVFNKEDWPTLITFFKSRMMALDSFWENARYAFDEFK